MGNAIIRTIEERTSPVDNILSFRGLRRSPLWDFFRMPLYFNHDFWWGNAGWNAFGWWEGENPFKDWWNGEGRYWYDANIAYVKNLSGKGQEKTYSEPKSGRALFIAHDFEQALGALEKIATSFSVEYEDGCVKLYAWNNEKLKACLMEKIDWEEWCNAYFKDDDDFPQSVLWHTYGVDTPNPVFKEGKLVFGDKFKKMPEEFVHDMATYNKR